MRPALMRNVTIRRLTKDAKIPYDLLLLADPETTAIGKYLDDSEVYIAALDDKVLGVFVLLPLEPTTVEIKNIAVEERYQRQGIGALMLAGAARIAKERNFNHIVIGTGNSSIEQLRLYQKHDFEIFDIRMNFFLDNYKEPIFENGIQNKHMIMLRKQL